MAFSLNKANLPASSASANATFAITSTTGNCILVGIITGSLAITCSAVTDSKSQSYTLNATHGSNTAGDAGNCYYAYFFSSVTGVTSITLTNTSGGVEIVAYDLSSTSGGTFDGIAAVNNGTNVTNPVVGPLAGTTAGGFAAALCSAVNNVTGVTPATFTFDTFDDSNVNGAGAHNVNSIGGTLNATFTSANSADWDGLIVSLKEAASTASIYMLAQV